METMEIPYKRLRELEAADPAYSIVEDGLRVEIIFSPPSRGEAMGMEETDEERPVLRIIGERRGDLVALREAWVEEGGGRRRMDLSELELWIQSLTD
ncbi:MAG: hypothetical protein RXO22_00285 [Thermocladium sp.]|jgi:hypothetical protein